MEKKDRGFRGLGRREMDIIISEAPRGFELALRVGIHILLLWCGVVKWG